MSWHRDSLPVSIHEAEAIDKDLSPIGRVTTSGEKNEYIHLGDQKYLKSELEYAFGGTFNPGLAVRPHLKLGNASPLALMAYAVTTITLSLIKAGARGLNNNNIMLGTALFYGGIVQVLAGFWELLLENTFGGTVFASYGGFWMSFSVLTVKGFNIEGSYESQKDLDNASGIFMLIWAIVSFLFMLCTIRSTVPMFSLLLTTTISFANLSASFFSSSIGKETISNNCTKVGGVFGCISGCLALYNAMGGLLNKENSYISIKSWFMPGAIRPEPEHNKKEA